MGCFYTQDWPPKFSMNNRLINSVWQLYIKILVSLVFTEQLCSSPPPYGYKTKLDLEQPQFGFIFLGRVCNNLKLSLCRCSVTHSWWAHCAADLLQSSRSPDLFAKKVVLWTQREQNLSTEWLQFVGIMLLSTNLYRVIGERCQFVVDSYQVNFPSRLQRWCSLTSVAEPSTSQTVQSVCLCSLASSILYLFFMFYFWKLF